VLGKKKNKTFKFTSKGLIVVGRGYIGRLKEKGKPVL
jgi:hypothetical protein